jgi:predicted nucleic acid-binding Zn ribbon protein
MAKLPDHGHCENCGDPVPFGERFCSDACSDEHVKEEKDAKNKDIRFYGILAGIIVAVAIVAYAVRTLMS